MPKIGIVIVNYNGEKYQNDCVKSLYEMKFSDFKIIVVDSGSSDRSIEMLKSQYPDVIIIEKKENVGVAVGNNIGIRKSIELGTQYTLLLNNDVEVDGELLSELLKKADDNTVVVPKIYYYEPNNMIWFGGGEFVFSGGYTRHIGQNEIDKGQFDKEKRINYSPTCCMLIPNVVFKKIGMMDETVFMYFDDTDFCMRLLKNNIPIKYIPSAKLWHKVSSSTGGEGSPLSVYYSTRNRFYFIKKHSDKMSTAVFIKTFVSFCIQYIISPVRCKNDKYILPAINDYFHGRMGRKDNLIKKK